MSTPDPREAVKGLLLNVTDRLTKDLKAIPAEKQNVSPMGAARTPLNIVAECAFVNGRIAEVLRVGTPSPRPAPEEQEKHLNSFDTEEKVLAYLQEETEVLLSTLESLSPERLQETTDFPFGRPITVLFLAEFASIHIMYHDGQLNYIHTLYGDTAVHW